jgi:hypothetical protein
MNRPETDLAIALRERLAIIADESSRRDPEQHLAKLQTVSEKIADLEKELPPSADRAGIFSTVQYESSPPGRPSRLTKTVFGG